MRKMLIQYLLDELKNLGVRDVFGVPGDYAFPIDDAVEADPELRWVGCCNELNAAYAADGYARIKGVAVLCTTFGVGELSAVGGLAGAYAEHLPVIHLVGMPARSEIRKRRVLHHTLGTGQFNLYAKMCAQVVSAGAILSPDNAVEEIRRVLQTAMRTHRPGYLAIPADVAVSEVVSEFCPIHKHFNSARRILADAVAEAAARLNQAVSPVVLPDYMIQRLGLRKSVQALLDKGNYPFATMMMGKGVLDESSPMINFHFDVEKNSIFYEFELSKVLKHPIVF